MTGFSDLLNGIFGHDFTKIKGEAEFRKRFFSQPITIAHLQQVFERVHGSSVTLADATIPAAIRIKGKKSADAPFAILAQLHGNEPAGQAGILLAMALSQAGLLNEDVIGVAGNTLAAAQYYAAYAADPKSRQETRDAYRCGLGEDGRLLADLNRIPVDFMSRDASDPHTKRAQELWAMGQRISGILDIHTARGNMTCITDHKRDKDLKNSPIRAVLTELADAIAAHASGAVSVQTLKTILHPLDNIQCQTGIEAGRHEHCDAPLMAAAFTLSTLSTLGLTPAQPLDTGDKGIFEEYRVRPKFTYADLKIKGKPQPGDKVLMAVACKDDHAIPPRSDRVIVKQKDGSYATQTILEYILTPKGKMHYAVYQYDEMEAIKGGAVVAVAIPSGASFHAPHDFSGIFFSKYAGLYDKDPAVGPWPVATDALASTKFCYPCDVGQLKLKF